MLKKKIKKNTLELKYESLKDERVDLLAKVVKLQDDKIALLEKLDSQKDELLEYRRKKIEKMKKEMKKMLNQLTLLGRITEINTEDSTVTLAVPRSFKNINGEYETDIIKCKLFEHKASVVNDCCENGDLIAIRGRVQNNEGNLEIVAEKVTFLQSKKKGE